MPLATFKLILTFRDQDFGSKVPFTNKKIELWKNELGYDELIGTYTTDRKNTIHASFEVDSLTTIPPQKIFVKVFDNGKIIKYKFEETDKQQAVLNEGSNVLTAIMDLADESVGVDNELVGIAGLLTNTTNIPYAGLVISTNIENSTGDVVAELGITTSNNQGYFQFSFVKDKKLTALLANNINQLNFSFVFYKSDTYIDTYQKAFSDIAGFEELLIIKTDLEIPEDVESSTLADVASLASVTISPLLDGVLVAGPIVTLKDIRDSGGLARTLSGLGLPFTPTDYDVAAKLDAHAQLETLSTNYAVNNGIINAGYNAVYKIAMTSRAKFCKDIKAAEVTSDFDALKYHRVAQLHHRVYSNMFTGLLMQAKMEGGSALEETIYDIKEICECNDCESSVSPMAYLSDLISYAEDNLKLNITPDSPGVFEFIHDGFVTKEQLQQLFCQDFCMSLTQCDSTFKKICQYRIAIEVLNCYRSEWLNPGNCQLTKFAEAEKAYIVASYNALLELLGTTYTELRDVMISGSEERKQKLADKLGIPLMHENIGEEATTIGTLYFSMNDDKEELLTKLETIFGLRNYTRACTDTQPKPFLLDWKQFYLLLSWADKTVNDDVYSVATTDAPKVVIDPDLIGPDDFRYTDGDIYPNANLRPFDIWKNRRKFLDDIDTKLLNVPANWSEKGFSKGYTEIKVAETDLPVTIGSKLKIGFAPGLNGIYDLVSTRIYDGGTSGDPDDDTLILTIDAILPELPTSAKVGFDNMVAVAEFTSNEIVFTRLLANPVQFVEVRGSAVNDGLYKVVSQADNGTDTTTLTVDGTLIATTDSTGDLHYLDYVDIILANTYNNKIILKDEYEAIIPLNQKITLSGSQGNDGSYTVLNTDNSSGKTIINIKEELKNPSDPGTGYVSFNSISYTGIDITPVLGSRTFTLEVPGLVNFPSTSTIEVKRRIGAPSLSTYNVADIEAAGSFSTVQVNEAIEGNEVGAILLITEAAVDVADNEFVIEGADLSMVFDASNSERNKVEINAVSYNLTSVTYSSGTGDTTFVIDEDQPIDDDEYTVKFPFIIKEVDTFGKQLVITSGSVPTVFGLGDKLVVDAGTGHPDSREFTITSYELVGSNKVYSVAEIVRSTTAITGATIYFKKTVPVVFSYPKLDEIFTEFTSTGSYNFDYTMTSGVSLTVPEEPWVLSGAITLSNLISKRDSWLGGDDTVEGNVWNELRLAKDAFITLVNIYEKHKLQLVDNAADRVTADEYRELFNIMLLAVKNHYATDWFAEEKYSGSGNIPVNLNYSDFWLSLTEPKEAEREVFQNLAISAIDPELISLSTLPDYNAGHAAIALYNSRVDALSALKELIKHTRINFGFERMLKYGLGGVNPTDDYPVDLSSLYQKVNGINPVETEKAAKDIETKLLINVDSFRTVMQLRERAGANNITPDEYNVLYSILTTAYKKRVLYPLWVIEEQLLDGDPTYHSYWLLSKEVLPSWRASLSARKDWQNALVSRSRIPVVDPDQVFVEDFANYTSQAYTTWVSRRAALANEYTTNIDGETIDVAIEYALGLDDGNITQFNLLQDMDEAGIDIRPRLAQLCLTYQSYTRLIKLKELGLENLLAEELRELVNILIQAIKLRKYYAAWNDEESSLENRENAIFLSHIFFKVGLQQYQANDTDFYDKLEPWRATWKDRREWEKLLKAHSEQWEGIDEVMDTYIEEVEKQVLPILRDGLVMLCGDEYATLEDNAKKLSDRFLVDFSINCCQHTTRIASAIDVLQKLIWTESIGIDKDIKLNEDTTLEFILDSDHFEAEWQWLGSYATWRAAMFVFMYPENLLLPSLKRHQSPAFIKLVNDIRGNSRLTPVDACRAAKEYSEYLDDVSHLEPAATSTAWVRMHNDSCLNKVGLIKEPIFFVFGARKAGTAIEGGNDYAYWQNRRYFSSAVDNFSFWQKLDGLGANVKRIIGSSIYQIESDIRHLYLFAVVHEELIDKLVYIKYDLEKQYWDEEYTELEVPKGTNYKSIAVLQRSREEASPKLLLQLGEDYKALYVNYLDRKAKDWEKDEWTQITTHKYAADFEKIHSYLEIRNEEQKFEEMIVAKKTGDNTLWFRFLVDNDVNSNNTNFNDDGSWRNGVSTYSANGDITLSGNFKGLVYTQTGSRDIALLYEAGSSVKQRAIRRMPKHPECVINSITDFDGWQYRWTGFSFNEFALTEGDRKYWFAGLKKIIKICKMSTYSQIKALAKKGNNYIDYNNSTVYPDTFVGLFKLYEDAAKIIFPPTEYIKGVIRNEIIGTVFSEGSSFNGESDDTKIVSMLVDILENYPNKLRGLSDWFYYEFAEKSKDVRALDLKFLNSKLLEQRQQYYNWDGDEKGAYNLAGVLRNIINRHDILNNFHNASHRYSSETYWKTILKGRERWSDSVSPEVNAPVLNNSISIVPNSGSFNAYFRAFTRAATDDAGNYGITIANKFQNGFNYVDFANAMHYRLTPVIPSNLTSITEEVTSAQLAAKKNGIVATYIANNYPSDPNFHMVSPRFNTEYMREAWYFVPMFLGIQLSQKGYYQEALKWFKTVYDYTREDGLLYENNRRIYWGTGLDGGSTNPEWERDMDNWLLDPLNPHSIAETRMHSYYKYTLSTIAQTFIAYADAQFTIDTVETVSQAKELYEFALELLGKHVLKQKPDECSIDIKQIQDSTICRLKDEGFPDLTAFTPAIDSLFNGVWVKSSTATQITTRGEALKTILIADIGTVEFDIQANITAAINYIDGLPAPEAASSLNGILNGADAHINTIHAAVMSLPQMRNATELIRNNAQLDLSRSVSFITGKSEADLTKITTVINWAGQANPHFPFDAGNADTQHLGINYTYPTSDGTYQLAATMDPAKALEVVSNYPFPYIPIFKYNFCVPENPVFKYASLSAELNLFKIRNCMNIAGMKRELDPYAAPTDAYTGLPQIGANGQLLLPGLNPVKPTIYRYEFLIERAKLLVSLAQQMEGAFLSMLEKLDVERYNILKAKQDLSLSKANVKLRDLQIKVAEGQVDLADLQKQRSEIQVQELDNMINAGLNSYEEQMIDFYYASAALQSIMVVGNLLIDMGSASGSDLFGISEGLNKALVGVGWGIKGAAEISNAFLNAKINANAIYASQERRQQQWNFEKTLGQQDIKIGAQQVKVAQDGVRVAGQERTIADLQQQHAEATIDFLNTKFTNAELYEWMSGVMERVYSYFLQEATASAKLAQGQMAFERQEAVQSFIQDDYWESPSNTLAIAGSSSSGPDRRGLTGSARLLQDVYRLDQYAIETDKRKLQITKTFSLASIAPMEFQQFKESGTIDFVTLMEHFDQDFPGHYLRLIKKVKVNVIALVPPTQGIKAMLTSSGISRVAIGGNIFQDVVVRRSPETIALSGSRESSGVFEMQAQDPKMLNAFEGSGVNMAWQFKMPKASNLFDYSTIADVLLTVEYTALHSYDYEREVNNRLGQYFVSDRAFSFRNEFADAFYQWNHSEEFDEGMKVSVDISKFDFPANVADVSMDAIKFYVITDQTDPTNLVFENPEGKDVTVQLNNSNKSIAGFNDKGIVSTLIGGGGLIDLVGESPVGNWQIELGDNTNVSNSLKKDFEAGKILDVIMIITYSGTTPKRN